ncbi:DUF4232 domain-containing protein [Streptomyces poonensis]|uniref:DUF4232 domain-containing protein n=1 Tax=Streptomyces poonensis TaxID=68255 RepID=A0A918PLZ9_9ACTN|nr:DUF4232 domain-containing protein [Streptomyces poonensis]GGZ15174.1 hypothetical protein GCM10010365_38570 [Streptomyces poonensis]GLJ91460.1 hypothetical protein GCM10017589_40670 [Streptomyces poonensis]
MRAFRTSVLAAATAALAALSLTACQNGTGVQDEGASQPAATVAATAEPKGDTEGAKDTTDGGTTEAGSGSAGNASQAKDSGTNTKTNAGSSNAKSGSGSSSSSGANANTDTDAPANRAICNGSNTTVSVQEVSRPLNHMLITVTNTGSKPCDLPYYPYVRFDQTQWAPQVAESTKPQAVVTLAPGESGYAGVMLASADGSGENGETAKKVTIGFQGLNPGSSGGTSTTVNLPGGGVYFDSTLRVTYWQQSMEDALY